jgi:hypothetical protein
MEDKNTQNLDEFLGQDKEQQDEQQVINSDKSIVEKVNKKIITDDGRQLLF